MIDVQPSVIGILASVPDCRLDRTKAYSLCAILLGTLIGVICDCDSYVDVADFMRSQREWLGQYVDMSNGAPSHDTISRVFRILSPVALSKAFSECLDILQIKLKDKIVAIDGKCVRRSYDHASGQRPIYMVSAWVVERGLVLGQIKVDKKSNEITAIPKLLDLIDVTGAIITIDAMGCQREIAKIIVDKGADYVLAVKDNQKKLANVVTHVLDTAMDTPGAGLQSEWVKFVDRAHGRFEERRYLCLSADAIKGSNLASKWAGLLSLIAVERRSAKDGKTTTERRYFISSLPPNVDTLAKAVRGHWGIENSLHWVLDVTFNEDNSRVRMDHGPENFAIIRHLSLNILKRDTSPKVSIRRKRKMAAREVTYRETLLKN
jgi:predicted transposase YbfD/YdcC